MSPEVHGAISLHCAVDVECIFKINQKGSNRSNCSYFVEMNQFPVKSPLFMTKIRNRSLLCLVLINKHRAFSVGRLR